MAPWSPRRRRPDIEDRATASGLADALRAGGLVDEAWYCRTYPDAIGPEADAVEDYASHGAAAGRDPNPCFSTRHYLEANPDVRATGMNPLLHYQ